jgi:hypothetical protein
MKMDLTSMRREWFLWRPAVFTDEMLGELIEAVALFEHTPGFGIKTVIGCASCLYEVKFGSWMGTLET